MNLLIISEEIQNIIELLFYEGDCTDEEAFNAIIYQFYIIFIL